MSGFRTRVPDPKCRQFLSSFSGCDKVLSPASGTEPRYSSLVGVISRYFVLLSVQLSLILSGPEHLMGEQRTQAIRWRWLGRARWRARWHESVAIDDLRHLCNNYELRSIYAICAIITGTRALRSTIYALRVAIDLRDLCNNYYCTSKTFEPCRITTSTTTLPDS